MRKQTNEITQIDGKGEIKILTSIEHIKLRPKIYMGNLGDGTSPDDGIYRLLKEIIDNSVDEYIMGYGKHIDINLRKNTIAVRDYGRGIQFETLVDCATKIKTGEKINSRTSQLPVEHSGIGMKLVNALSERFTVISYRNRKFRKANFLQGKLDSESTGKSSKENGTYIMFTPDPAIFSKYKFKKEFIKMMLLSHASGNNGLSLSFNREQFNSNKGLCNQGIADSPNAISPKTDINESMSKKILSARCRLMQDATAMPLNPSFFCDCKCQPEGSVEKDGGFMIFITEAESASGCILACRDPYTQAILTLPSRQSHVDTGKTTCKITIDLNRSLLQVIKSLGIESKSDNLRYNTIIIATKKDAFGIYMRKLLVKFFQFIFPEIVFSGHVSILEYPTYKVSSRRNNIYCFDDQDYKNTLIKLGTEAETNRFSSIGQFSPSEFEQFIGRKIKLTPVKPCRNLKAYDIPDVLKEFTKKSHGMVLPL